MYVVHSALMALKCCSCCPCFQNKRNTHASEHAAFHNTCSTLLRADGFVGRWLGAATAYLPRSGRVRTAFGTTTAALITQALPRDLLFPVTTLATGKADILSALAAVDNVSTTFTEYFEATTLLGDEVLRFGRTRVRRAEFHGEAPNRFAAEGILHRAAVLLWALANQPTGSMPFPQVVEVGVNRAECSVRLLASHEQLTWLGVDLYVAADRKGIMGGSELADARAALAPWLGRRAQLLLDQSTSAAKSWRGLRNFDLAFLDADHEEHSVKSDIEAWSPLVKEGGVVAGHDYARIWPGVVQAAHASLPNTTLHVAPDMVFWWYKPHQAAYDSHQTAQADGRKEGAFHGGLYVPAHTRLEAACMVLPLLKRASCLHMSGFSPQQSHMGWISEHHIRPLHLTTTCVTM